MIYNLLNVNTLRKIDLCGKLKFEKPLPHPDRTLEHHDLVYVLEGGFNVVVDNLLIESRKGDIMFLPANIRHYPRYDNYENSQCYFVHFNYDVSDAIHHNKPTTSNSSFYCIPSHFHVNNDSIITTLFHELSILTTFSNTANDKIVNSLLVRILSEIEGKFFNKDLSKTSVITTDIISLLVSNPNKQFRLTELAKIFNYAPRTLQKYFKEDTGKSIRDYHLEIKLNKSKYFLTVYPNMPLKEISSMFGFYDEFYFSKSFKKHFGISPKNFRISKSVKDLSIT